MRAGSLFSGIGGLDLAVEHVFGARTAWQVECDPFCRDVLAQQWPEARRFHDVRTALAEGLDRVEIIAGGFPCQDVSVAGKRKGLAGARSGLWRCFADIVRALRPRVVVVENVPGLLSMEFGDVLGDLAEVGFAAEWGVFSAADVGAPHLRERVFLVALADAEFFGREGELEAGAAPPPALGSHRDALADADRAGRSGREDGDIDAPRGLVAPRRDNVDRRAAHRHGAHRAGDGCGGSDGRSPQPGVGRGVDGVPGWLDGAARWPAGRGQSQAPWEPPRVTQERRDRRKRVKALGNAVCPQQAVLALRVLLSRFVER